MTRNAVARRRAHHPGQLMFTWPAEDTAPAEATHRPSLPVICGALPWPRSRRLREDQCRWTTQYGSPCARHGGDDPFGVALCSQHVKNADRHLWGYLHDHPRIVTDLYWQLFEESRFGSLPAPGRSVVYFVERQGFIKIGTTTSLEKRLREIGKGGQMIQGMTVGPVRLLATMPGDHRHEKFLHDQFHSLRIEGEWFLPDSRLCEFIHRLPNVDFDLLYEVEIHHGIAEPDEADSVTA